MSNNWHTPTPDLIEGDIARADDVNAKIDAVDLAFEKLPEPAVGGKGFGEPIKVGDPTDATHAASKGWAETEGTSFVNQSATSAANAAASETAAATSETNAASSATASAASATASSGSATNAASSETAAASSADLAERYAEEDEDVEVETGTFSAKHWSAKAQVGASNFSVIETDSGTATAQDPADTLTLEGIGGGTVTASGQTISFDSGIESREALAASIPPPTLDLDFANGGVYRYATASKIVETNDLTSFATYSRGGDPVTFYGPSGFENLSANDEPVIDYNPFTRELRGLLFQPTRTNDIDAVRDFSDAAWGKSNLTVTQDQVGPDGQANSAWSVVENSDTAQVHNLIRSYTIVDGESRNVKLKLAPLGSGGRSLRLRMDAFPGAPSDNAIVIFNPDDGTFSSPTVGGNGTLINYGAEEIGNGFYEAFIAFSWGAGVTDARILLDMVETSTGNVSYDGDGTSGIILYSANAQEGDIPTSDIRANNLRDADSLLIDEPVARNILNKEEGTLFWDLTLLSYSTTDFKNVTLRLNGASADDRIELSLATAAGPNIVVNARTYIAAAIEDSSFISVGEVARGERMLLAVTYSQGGNIEASFNGQSFPITAGDVWTPDVQKITCGDVVIRLAHGTRQIKYRPKRLTQEQLNYLTRPNQ